jgi:hypothetical protein
VVGEPPTATASKLLETGHRDPDVLVVYEGGLDGGGQAGSPNDCHQVADRSLAASTGVRQAGGVGDRGPAQPIGFAAPFPGSALPGRH